MKITRTKVAFVVVILVSAVTLFAMYRSHAVVEAHDGAVEAELARTKARSAREQGLAESSALYRKYRAFEKGLIGQKFDERETPGEEHAYILGRRVQRLLCAPPEAMADVMTDLFDTRQRTPDVIGTSRSGPRYTFIQDYAGAIGEDWTFIERALDWINRDAPIRCPQSGPSAPE